MTREESLMTMAREIALELDDGTLPSEELLEEAYLGLAEALHELGENADEDVLDDRIREHMHQYRKAYEDSQSSDDYLVTQVQILNDSINRLTEELGTRPNLDELANDMGISQEKVIDILKLTGEDIEPLTEKKKSFEWNPDWNIKL